jgi:alkylation response protein AidB-like acyl-CoA dehydrogenase
LIVDLLPTAEQDEIVASVRAVLEDRHALGAALDETLWSAAVEQGWFAIGLPEDLGGVGYSLAEEALVFEEIGRAAAPGPFLATALAARVAAEGGAPELATELIGGARRAALAEPEGDGVRVTDHVGSTIALLLDDEVSLVSLDDVEVDEQPSIDVLVPLATAATPTSRLAVAADPAAIRRRATVLVAAQLAGIAEATASQSVAYAKDREQFGQPIGGFQAVKHRCADMAVRADMASSQVRWAALATERGQSDAAFHAEAAAVVAIDAALANASINIQNHGGIGFTWEHTAHRYLTRARMWAATLGGLRGHQARLLAAPTPD